MESLQIDMNKLTRKLNAALCSGIRNFPRNDRNLLHNLTPARICDTNTELAMLLRTKDFHSAVWAAYSALLFVEGIGGIRFLIDGSLSDKRKAVFRRIFPNCHIQSVNKLSESFQDKNPWTRQYADEKFGPKLFNLLSLQKSRPVLYVDSDVLFFGPAIELSDSIQTKNGKIFRDCGSWTQDDVLLNRAEKLSLQTLSHANAGLIFMPQNSLCDEIAEELLSFSYPSNVNLFFEQTTMAILAAESRYTYLPKERYVVNNTGMIVWNRDIAYENIVCRHFVGNVRHRLWLNGLPRLRQLV